MRKQRPWISNGLFDNAAHGLVCLVGLREWCTVQSQVGLIRDYSQLTLKKIIKIKQMNVVLAHYQMELCIHINLFETLIKEFSSQYARFFAIDNHGLNLRDSNLAHTHGII